MTPHEIETALKVMEPLPREALRAGVDQAAELAYDRAERFCRGIYLLPGDLNVLANGLHVLAAARHPDLMGHLIELLRQPDEDLDRLFPLRVSTGVARLLLSVWDRPTEDLLRMIEYADVGNQARAALYAVLARLTFDGRVNRGVMAEFLTRVERDDLHGDDAADWWGWQDTVCRLGIVELEPALERVWGKETDEVIRQRERDEALEELREAAAKPSDASGFDAEDIRPISDPVEALEWIERREAALAAYDGDEETETETEPDTDPAAAVRLTPEELDWLDGFLVSRQVPASTMGLEQFDGFLTALVIGPETVLPSEYMPLIWGDEDGARPTFEDAAQAEYVMGLLLRHWNAIATRRAANAEHEPVLEPYGDGEAWGLGFLQGIELRNDAWEPIFKDRRSDQIVLPILALSGEAPEEVYVDFDDDAREAVLDQLPVTLQMIAAYWQSPGGRLTLGEPVRSTKVGRNEPCPCGSGKKFKKCCGDSSRLH